MICVAKLRLLSRALNERRYLNGLEICSYHVQQLEGIHSGGFLKGGQSEATFLLFTLGGDDLTGG